MIILLFLFLFAIPVSAQTPTVNQSDNIQSIRDVVEKKVKEKLRQIANPGSEKKAIIGKVIQIDSSSITIEYNSSTRKLTLDPDTVFVNSTGNKIGADKIKVGQDIIAMGTGSDSFIAKRIVLTDIKKAKLSRTIVVGKIVDISRTSPLFTLISSQNKNDLFQIKTDAKTSIGDKNQQKIKLSDIKAGQKIIAVLTPDEKISKTYYAIKLISLDSSQSTKDAPTPTKK